MNRKGISPVLASVLVLAVTLAVTSIFSGWAPDVVRSVTSETKNQTEKTIDCNRAGIKILEAKYFSKENTSIVARNTGRSDLDQLKAVGWESDLPMNDTSFSLKKGNYTTVNVTTGKKPDYVKVISEDCSSVTDKEETIN